MKSKRIILIILFLCSNGFAQTSVFVNPGIKIGFAFGEKVEFNFGYELSLVFFKESDPDYNKYGIVIDYDNIYEIKRLHIGFEYIRRFVGIDIGPTLGWKGDNFIYGFSVIPFGGAILLPYYNFTYFNKESDIQEIGTYLKIPIGDVGWRN